jgi:hypothetical protein
MAIRQNPTWVIFFIRVDKNISVNRNNGLEWFSKTMAFSSTMMQLIAWDFSVPCGCVLKLHTMLYYHINSFLMKCKLYNSFTVQQAQNAHTFTPVCFSSTTLFKMAGHSITKLITVNSGRIEVKMVTKLSWWYAGYGNCWRFNCEEVSHLLQLCYSCL